MSGSLFSLDSVQGLDINGVLYKYTAVKNPADPMQVHVQNEDAVNGGYIFRETDDWSGLPGSTINKFTVIPNIPIKYWGAGSIEVEGVGQVTDPTVIYSYRLNPCAGVQNDPACGNVIDPLSLVPKTEVEVYNALEDPNVANATQETDREVYDDNDEKEDKQKEDKRRKDGAKAAATAVASAVGISQDAMIQAMNSVNNLTPYLTATIPGGSYGDTVALIDSKLPESRQGLRNGLAQQVLHNRMVGMQYGR